MLNQSYVHGASSTPFLDATIGRQFDRAVEQHSDREALVVRAGWESRATSQTSSPRTSEASTS